MSFNVRKDMFLFNRILEWDGMRKVNFSVEGAADWTDKELKELAHVTDEEIATFRKNLESCQKSAKERKSEDTFARLIEVSKRVAVYRDAIYYLDKNGVFISGFKARDKMCYAVSRTVRGATDIAAFMTLDDDSEATLVTNLKTRYIVVGNKYFDTLTGKMVDEAPMEFRTYKIYQNVDYHPVSFNDCKSRLIKDLKYYLGAEELRYILLSVAYSLTDLRNDKRTIILLGESRSCKTTICNVLQRIGVMPDEDFSDDLSGKGEFMDSIGEHIGLYPAVSGSECETVNWKHVKKMSSDPTTQINRKGEPAITVANRAFIILSANRSPKTNLIGVVNKIAILETKHSYSKSVNTNYLEEIEAEEGYEELICLILTMAHKLTKPADEMPDKRQWKPSAIEEIDCELKETHFDYCRRCVPTDLFYAEWNREANEKTPFNEAYAAYLCYCNPDADGKAINEALEASKTKPSNAPVGLNGNSRSSFINDAKSLGIKFTRSGNMKYFVGRPPYIDDDVELADLC